MVLLKFIVIGRKLWPSYGWKRYICWEDEVNGVSWYGLCRAYAVFRWGKANKLVINCKHYFQSTRKGTEFWKEHTVKAWIEDLQALWKIEGLHKLRRLSHERYVDWKHFRLVQVKARLVIKSQTRQRGYTKNSRRVKWQ